MIDPHLFQRLTVSEIQRYSLELDHAIESHNSWVSRVSRALICRQPCDPADLADEPHRLCQFGRWYSSIDHAVLREMPDFTAIDQVHVEVHRSARDLLRMRGVDCDLLDRFFAASERLRDLLHRLRSELKQNLGVISRLTGKVFENANEGVVITAPDGTILNVNRAFSQVTGYAAAEVIGRNPNILYSGRQDSSFYSKMWESLKEAGHWTGEIWNRRKDGRIYPEWLSISAVKDESGETTHYVGIFSDITSEKENEERLYRLAHFDPLTGLPNRMTFHDRLRQALAQARRGRSRLAVLFMDLDGFKQVNDTLGHRAGDELLRQVAARLTGCLRESDTVARFGGDEFTLVLPGVDEQGVRCVAEKLIAAVGCPYTLHGQPAEVTTSIGISCYPADGADADRLVTAADTAMYRSKSAGKNRFLFFGVG